MADLALALELLHRLVHARAVAGAVCLVGAMELVDVHVVGLEQAQRGLQVRREARGVLCARLGGDGHAVAHALEGDAHLLLGVGIGARGVEEGHAALVGAAQQPDGLAGRDTLDGKGAEGVLWRRDAG